MDPVSYTNGSDVYRVEPITDHEQVGRDYATVYERVQDTGEYVYKKRMHEGIDQGLAYAVYKNEDRVGFVYNRVEGYDYLGSSIWLGYSIETTVLGLKHMFEICDKHKIQFTPHEGSVMNFRSIVTGPSLRSYIAGYSDVVTIMRDEIYNKGLQMFKYLGLRYE